MRSDPSDVISSSPHRSQLAAVVFSASSSSVTQKLFDRSNQAWFDGLQAHWCGYTHHPKRQTSSKKSKNIPQNTTAFEAGIGPPRPGSRNSHGRCGLGQIVTQPTTDRLQIAKIRHQIVIKLTSDRKTRGNSVDNAESVCRRR